MTIIVWGDSKVKLTVWRNDDRTCCIFIFRPPRTITPNNYCHHTRSGIIIHKRDYLFNIL
jgi:hypothetical protein